MDYFVHQRAFVESKKVGRGSRIWAFSHIMEGAEIGRDCNVGEHCFIESGAVIGNNVVVKNGVSVWEKIRVEDNVFLGPNMVFTNDLFPRSGVRDRSRFLPVVVKKGASIGANSTIVCGITIGEYAFIGAGSVVTKDVPPFSIVYGNPARFKGHICACAGKLEFSGGRTRCKCGKNYSLKGGIARLIKK